MKRKALYIYALLAILPAASAQVLDPWNVAVVAVTGSVLGQPETVGFSGQAHINSRLARDPDFNHPTVIFSIDMSGVPGTGASTLASYVVSGPELVQRSLATTHLVDITFPFAKEGAPDAPRSGLASFALTIDVNTGAVTAATASLGTPAF